MSRLEWILGILLAVLLLVVAAISLMLWFRPTVPTAVPELVTEVEVELEIDPLEVAPTSVYEGETAQFAYAAAQQTAVADQPDAVLLSASADWPHGSGLTQLEDGRTTWLFGFYSPSTGKTAVYAVADGDVSYITESAYQPTITPLINAGSWEIDSNQAMQHFLDEGARAFIQREGVTTTTFTFSTDNPDDYIEWNMIIFSANTGNAFQLKVNATTGESVPVVLTP